MNAIRDLREAKGLTQAELARAFRLAHARDCTVQELGLVDTGA